MSSDAHVVVKVGGSLFVWPGLTPQLHHFLVSLEPANVLLVPGGGEMADAVRQLDQRHGLGEEAAHWLALRAVTVNAYLLAALLNERSSCVVSDIGGCEAAWRDGLVPILDGYAFAGRDDGRPGCLAHAWTAGTDCLALRAAAVLHAGMMVLLKSIAIPADVPWDQAAERGWVDAGFTQTWSENSGLLAQAFHVRAVNLKTWPA